MNPLLLAMQAAGMIVDYFGTKSQDELMKMGMKVQQAGIQSELATTRLESQNASLESVKQLRQTLGSQIAASTARGTSVGAGSALSLLNESVSNFNSDERIRKLNLLGKENQLNTRSIMSKLQYSSESSKLWQGFASRTFKTVSSNPSNYFGMTPIGGG